MTAPTKDEVAEARRFFTTEPTRSIMPPWCATHGETILRALDAAEAERDELARWKETHSWSSTLRTRAETAEAERARLAKNQPCGCVVCTCDHEERCLGCGAKSCDRHRAQSSSLATDPAAVFEPHTLSDWPTRFSRNSPRVTRRDAERARAEKAEARVRELEAAIAEWAQAHDGTDYSVQVEMNGRLRAVGMRSRKEG